MKMTILYGLIWIIFAAAAITAYMTDSLSPTNLAIFGFLGSTLFFIGLVALLPFLVNRHHQPK